MWRAGRPLSGAADLSPVLRHLAFPCLSLPFFLSLAYSPTLFLSLSPSFLPVVCLSVCKGASLVLPVHLVVEEGMFLFNFFILSIHFFALSISRRWIMVVLAHAWKKRAETSGSRTSPPPPTSIQNLLMQRLKLPWTVCKYNGRISLKDTLSGEMATAWASACQDVVSHRKPKRSQLQITFYFETLIRYLWVL